MRDSDSIGIVYVVGESELLSQLVASVEGVLDNEGTVVLMES